MVIFLELTGVDERRLLVNFQNVAVVRAVSKVTTEIHLSSGACYEVQGSYEQVLDSLQKLRDVDGQRK